MKVTKEQNAAHHRAIVEAASRLFRERGFDEVSVVDVMNEAGLTHGAFYGHFGSKAALAADACQQAFEQRIAGWVGDVSLSKSLDGYLSQTHRDNPDTGCPMAAFVSKIANQDKIVQKRFAKGVSDHVEEITGHLATSGLSKAQAKKQASAIVATMIGGLALARSIAATDRDLSSEILANSRAAIKKQFGI